MVLLFTCGMKAHTPVMYTGSEKSWNGGRARLWFCDLGGLITHFFIMCVFNWTFQGGNQLLFEHWQLCVCVSLSLIAIIVGWFVPIFCVLRVTQRAYLRLRILCHIQKHAKNPREKKKYQGTNLMVLWTLVAFLPNIRAYMYDICMSVRRGCWCRMLDVDRTVHQRIISKTGEGKHNCNEQRIWAVESLSSWRLKLDFLQNSTKTSLISIK